MVVVKAKVVLDWRAHWLPLGMVGHRTEPGLMLMWMASRGDGG